MSPVPLTGRAPRGNIHRLVIDTLSIAHLFNIIFIRTSPPMECLELLRASRRTLTSREQAHRIWDEDKNGTK